MLGHNLYGVSLRSSSELQVRSESSVMDCQVVFSLLLPTKSALELVDDLVSGRAGPAEPGLGALPEGEADGRTSGGRVLPGSAVDICLEYDRSQPAPMRSRVRSRNTQLPVHIVIR